jgi:hypothetical protein
MDGFARAAHTEAESGKRSVLHKFFNIEESDVDAATPFASAKTRQLHEWWLGANGGRMPSKRVFDVTQHRSIVANLFLIEVAPDGQFIFRLLGEEVIKMIGANPVGQTVKQSGQAEYGHALDEYYRSVARAGGCRRCFGSLATGGQGYRDFESVDCPLSSDGRRVDYIVGVMDLLD